MKGISQGFGCKKIRAVVKSKGEAGEHLCTNPPYGYMKHPDNKKLWIVDKKATKVVRRIFRLCFEGDGPTQIACVTNHEEQFRKAMGAKQKDDVKQELAAKRRQLTQAERRIEELDRLFKHIYEDNANGKLSGSKFQMLSDDYEQEQKELREKLLQLNEEINQQEEQAENIERFISKVHKYLDLNELTPAVLKAMVKAFYVHAPDKLAGG